MQKKLVWLALCIVAITVVYHAEFARATPASGFTATTITKGTFNEFQVSNHLTRDQLPVGFPGNTWFSFQKTEGPSDLYVQNNTWLPGGSTGWHRHPGHSLIVITSGLVTQYHADCVPQVYGPGTANGPTLVDSGNDEHLIRNEGFVVATGFAVQLVANGAPRRIDEPAPGSCQIF